MIGGFQDHNSARTFCAQFGAALAVLDDWQEYQAVHDWLRTQVGTNSVWLGLHSTSISQWLWDNGEPFNTEWFASDEPGYGDNAGYIHVDYDIKGHSNSRNIDVKPLCQILDADRAGKFPDEVTVCDQDQGCPFGFTNVTGSCCYMMGGFQNHRYARTFCAQFGAALAVLDDWQEYQAVLDWLRTQEVNNDLWLALHISSTGLWIWDSGVQVNRNWWASGEPASGKDAAYIHGTEYDIHSDSDIYSKRVLCQLFVSQQTRCESVPDGEAVESRPLDEVSHSPSNDVNEGTRDDVNDSSRDDISAIGDDSPFNRDLGVLVPALAGSVAVLLILLVVVSVVMFVRTKRKSENSDSEENITNDTNTTETEERASYVNAAMSETRSVRHRRDDEEDGYLALQGDYTALQGALHGGSSVRPDDYYQHVYDYSGAGPREPPTLTNRPH